MPPLPRSPALDRSASCRSRQEPAIAVAIERLHQRLDLHLDVLDRLQVRVELRRQLAGELLAVGLELLLLLDQTPPRILELRLEKLVRAFSEHLTIAQVLLDEQRRQPLGDPHHGARVPADIADPEGVALDDLHVDLLVRIRSTMSSMIPVRRSSAYRLKS